MVMPLSHLGNHRCPLYNYVTPTCTHKKKQCILRSLVICLVPFLKINNTCLHSMLIFNYGAFINWCQVLHSWTFLLKKPHWIVITRQGKFYEENEFMIVSFFFLKRSCHLEDSYLKQLITITILFTFKYDWVFDKAMTVKFVTRNFFSDIPFN